MDERHDVFVYIQLPKERLLFVNLEVQSCVCGELFGSANDQPSEKSEKL